MLELASEFDEYISQVIFDFTQQAGGIKKLESMELKRQKLIRMEIIALIKIYKDMALSNKEQKLIDQHLMQYDFKNDIVRCICQVAYETSDKVYDKVREYKKGVGDYNFLMACYDYLGALVKYKNSLLHAISYKHAIILTNPESGEKIYPKMNFDNECFILKNKAKKLSLKK